MCVSMYQVGSGKNKYQKQNHRSRGGYRNSDGRFNERGGGGGCCPLSADSTSGGGGGGGGGCLRACERQGFWTKEAVATGEPVGLSGGGGGQVH